jgi:hypothetical protein
MYLQGASGQGLTFNGAGSLIASGGLYLDTTPATGSDVTIRPRQAYNSVVAKAGNGNVGIKTTDPSQTLHVSGSVLTTSCTGIVGDRCH